MGDARKSDSPGWDPAGLDGGKGKRQLSADSFIRVLRGEISSTLQRGEEVF